MTQEVQIVLTIEVDITRERQDIIDFTEKITKNISKKYFEFLKVEIKEEAEIYETEPIEKGKIDLRECRKGDILISSLGARLEYVRPTKDDEYLDHIVRYLDESYQGSRGSRTHDGYVFKFNRQPETDHDIVEIIKKKK